MISNRVNKNPVYTKRRNAINQITAFGFFLRFTILTIMLTVCNNEEGLYFLNDDVLYEATAAQYLQHANSAIDIACLDSILIGYLQPFWPAAMCLLSGIFRTVFVGRILNIILSTLSINLVYKITMILSGKEKTALLAGKFFAFLPVTVLTCCFPIKDIFLTWATLYVFYVFLQLDVNQTPKVREVVLCAICLIGIYYTRGAVAELLMVFLAAIMFHRYWMLKNYRAVLVVSMISLIAAAFFGDSVVDALRTKTEDYSDYNTMSTGFLSLLQMQSTRQFYKLPFAYVYASFQPMVLKIFGSNISSWLQAISIANISIYPIAIANAVYIFQKKHHKLFWFAGVAMLCAVISVSLGIFRHYLFLMPLIFINGALCFEKLTKNGKVVILICSAGVFLLVALYSML